MEGTSLKTRNLFRSFSNTLYLVICLLILIYCLKIVIFFSVYVYKLTQTHVHMVKHSVIVTGHSAGVGFLLLPCATWD